MVMQKGISNDNREAPDTAYSSKKANIVINKQLKVHHMTLREIIYKWTLTANHEIMLIVDVNDKKQQKGKACLGGLHENVSLKIRIAKQFGLLYGNKRTRSISFGEMGQKMFVFYFLVSLFFFFNTRLYITWKISNCDSTDKNCNNDYG